MNTSLSLGEYVRRLRRRKGWQLQELANASGLSVSHLSRIENDNALPNADTVVKLAQALGGELERMLEMADCLPREILERLIRRVDDGTPALHRSAAGDEPQDPEFSQALVEDMDPQLRRMLAGRFGLSERDVGGIFTVLQRVGQMAPNERESVIAFLAARTRAESTGTGSGVPGPILGHQARKRLDVGILHRERLVRQFMDANGLVERPLLKNIVDELIEDQQGARLRDEVLPLDRFAQTELVGGRAIVSIDSRLADIPGVKDAAGVGYVAKWHESVHVERDLGGLRSDGSTGQGMLPGFEADVPRLLVCRWASKDRRSVPQWEFVAENAGLAAAIAREDLVRSAAFAEFQRRAARGGDLGATGWRLLYEVAAFIGANITALVRYLEHRDVCQVIEDRGSRRLVAYPQLFRELE